MKASRYETPMEHRRETPMEHGVLFAGITDERGCAACARSSKVMRHLKLSMACRGNAGDGHATPYPALALICLIRMRTLRTRE